MSCFKHLPLLLPFAIFFLIVQVFAQQRLLHFDHISVEEGLSQNEVNCIYQDRKGFLWFGTEDGLNKYDGYHFTKYKHIPGDTTCLSDNRIQAIVEDSDGIIWIGTADGLNRFDRQTDHFIQYRHETQSLHHNDVRAITEDRNAMLWIGTKGRGITRLPLAAIRGDTLSQPANTTSDENNQTEMQQQTTVAHFFNDPNNPNSLSNDNVEAILEDSRGFLWIATDNGLNRFDPTTEDFFHYGHQPDNPNSLVHNIVERLYEDRSGSLWIGTGSGLSKFDAASETFTNYLPEPADPADLKNLIWAIFEDQADTFWIGTVGGLATFDRERGTFDFYHHETVYENSISHNVINSIFEDRSGVLWIGTDGGGLSKVNVRKSQFRHFRHVPGNPNSLSYNTISSFCEDRNGAIWIGTIGGGLNKMILPTANGETPREARFYHYRHNPKNPYSLGHKSVLSICEDPSGDLWVGTWGGGLDRFNQRSGIFKHYTHQPGNSRSLSDPDNEIWVLYNDRQNRLWIGTDGGLNLLVRPENQVTQTAFDGSANESEHFVSFQHDPGTLQSLRHNRIQAIYQDSRSNGKRLWIGTLGGLSLMEWEHSPQEGVRFTHFQNDPHKKNSLSHNGVITIYEDSTAGVLWLGTLGGGLNRYHLETGEFTRYTSKDGLPNDIVYGILQDDEGFIWVSTNGGLSKCNLMPRYGVQFHNYDVNDGLQSNLFSHNAYLKLRNGKMMFGGVNGFNMFTPKTIEQNYYVPPVVITAFKEFDEIVKRDISDSLTLQLSHDENFFSMEFSALDYNKPGKNRYAYKLEGFDKEWRYRDAENRIASYTNLDDGKYRFHVKGSNSDGIWNEKGLSVRIVVIPPLWKRSWFQWMMGFGIILLATTIYGVRLRSVRKQNELLEEQVKERTAELSHSNEQLEEKTRELSDTNLRLQDEVVERRKAEIAAESANKAKSDFLANMSHELRTPLNGILGFAQILKKDKNLMQKQLAAIETIKQSGKHLLTLITDLLDISKIEAGKMELMLSEFQLREFLNAISGIFKFKVAEKRITFVEEFDESLPEAVMGDEKRLRQVLLNLISNAVKFTPAVSASGETGKVIFRVRRVDAKICFEVSDNGIGIAKDKLEEIFLPFEQVNDKQNYTSEGTGLGLSISRRLVELMGSELKVNSSPGKGSTFWMDLELEEITQAVARKGTSDSSPSEIIDQQSIPFPPGDELEAIYKSAKIGDISGIMQTLEKIEKIDDRYLPFSEKIRTLAQNFEVLKIRELLEKG